MLFTRGKAISGAPSIKGTNQLPNSSIMDASTPEQILPRGLFSGLRFFNEPQYLRLGTYSLKSLPEDMCSGLLYPGTPIVFIEPTNLRTRAKHEATEVALPM